MGEKGGEKKFRGGGLSRILSFQERKKKKKLFFPLPGGKRFIHFLQGRKKKGNSSPRGGRGGGKTFPVPPWEGGGKEHLFFCRGERKCLLSQKRKGARLTPRKEKQSLSLENGGVPETRPGCAGRRSQGASPCPSPPPPKKGKKNLSGKREKRKKKGKGPLSPFIRPSPGKKKKNLDVPIR